MPTDTYNIITTEGEGLYKDKGSKFIARAFAVNSEAEAKERIAATKKQYYDARHCCYAYMIGPDKSLQRSNDDGEPSGTAGKPILNQILSKDVTNVCVTVVRYFGGVLLGTSGLIAAYKSAARQALDQATIEQRTIDMVIGITFGYDLMNTVMHVIKDENLTTLVSRFAADCYVEVAVRQSRADYVVQRLSNIYGLRLGRE